MTYKKGKQGSKTAPVHNNAVYESNQQQLTDQIQRIKSKSTYKYMFDQETKLYQMIGRKNVQEQRVAWIIDVNNLVFIAQEKLQLQNILETQQKNLRISILENALNHIIQIQDNICQAYNSVESSHNNMAMNMKVMYNRIIIVGDQSIEMEIKMITEKHKYRQLYNRIHVILIKHEFMPLISTQGKVVFKSPYSLLSTNSSDCHTLNHLLNCWNYKHDNGQIKTNLLKHYYQEFGINHVILISLDHLYFQLDYEYSLGLMYQKKLEILFGYDKYNKKGFVMFHIPSLINLNSNINFFELVNNFREHKTHFQVYSHYTRQYENHKLMVYRNDFENLLKYFRQSAFIKYSSPVYSFEQDDDINNQMDQQTYNFKIVEKYNRDQRNNSNLETVSINMQNFQDCLLSNTNQQSSNRVQKPRNTDNDVDVGSNFSLKSHVSSFLNKITISKEPSQVSQNVPINGLSNKVEQLSSATRQSQLSSIIKK